MRLRLLGPIVALTTFACGGAVAPSDPQVAAGPLSGTVVDAMGEPAPDVKVLVGDAVFTTDARGHFDVPYADALYDAAVAPSTSSAYVFQGMSTRTPTLRTSNEYLSPATELAARLTVHPPSDLPPHTRVRVSPFLPDDVHAFVGFNGPETAVLFSLGWLGPARVPVTLYAVEYEEDPDTHAPSRIVGEATSTITLSSGDVLDVMPAFTFKAAPQTTVSGTVNLPAGYAMDGSSILLTLPSLVGPLMISSDRMGPTFSFATPSGPSLRLIVQAGSAESFMMVSLDAAPGSGPLAFDIPAGPRALSPDDGATGIGVGSELRWSTFAGGTSFVRVTATDLQGAALTIHTAGNAATIPDLSRLGFAFPAKTGLDWEVFETNAASRVDDLAAIGVYGDAPTGTRIYGYSSRRTVTTR